MFHCTNDQCVHIVPLGADLQHLPAAGGFPRLLDGDSDGLHDLYCRRCGVVLTGEPAVPALASSLVNRRLEPGSGALLSAAPARPVDDACCLEPAHRGAAIHLESTAYVPARSAT